MSHTTRLDHISFRRRAIRTNEMKCSHIGQITTYLTWAVQIGGLGNMYDTVYKSCLSNRSLRGTYAYITRMVTDPPSGYNVLKPSHTQDNISTLRTTLLLRQHVQVVQIM